MRAQSSNGIMRIAINNYFICSWESLLSLNFHAAECRLVYKQSRAKALFSRPSIINDANHLLLPPLDGLEEHCKEYCKARREELCTVNTPSSSHRRRSGKILKSMILNVKSSNNVSISATISMGDCYDKIIAIIMAQSR